MAEVVNTDLWIGLHSIRKDEFFWTDGKSRKYTNWGYAVRTNTDHNLKPKESISDLHLLK